MSTGATHSVASRGFSLGNISLRGVVSAVPSRQIANDYFVEKFGEKSVEEVVALTGVKNRHWVTASQTTSDLCEAAANTLLDRLGWSRHSVDALIFVSQTPDYRIPATACVIHGRLGLAPTCQAFDVALGCSGYVYGLWLGSTLITAGCSRVLVLAGDTISRTVDPDDRGTSLLFGDAGSASALEASPSAPTMHYVLGTDGSGVSNLIIPGGGFREFTPDSRMRENFDPAHLFMDGGKVFTFTLGAVPKLVRTILHCAGRKSEDVDAFLLHQANEFMLRHLAKKMGLLSTQLPMNIDRFGNTSSASIPLLITTELAGSITRGEMRLVPVGFGVGYSWAAAFFDKVHLECAETITI